MILRNLVLRNFRQFFGEQRIDFAPPGPHNVTIIYGANGAGKTTLLNAFTWALFDEVTPAFENRQRLLNERVSDQLSAGTASEVMVHVCFEHEDRIYDVRRVQRVFRDEAGTLSESAATRSISVQGPNGMEQRPDDGADIIGQILPTELHQFFFFDGERIEKLVNPRESSQDLDRAVKTILGLEVLERALEHLPKAKKALRDEMGRLDVGVGTNDLIAVSDQLEREVLELTNKLQVHRDNRDGLQAQRLETEKLLREHAVARERQLLVDSLKKEESELAVGLSEARRNTRAALSDRSFLAFTAGLAESTSALVEQLRERGRLPAPYEAPFVNDLLNAEECICGTPLIAGSDARRRVGALLSAGGDKDLQTVWIRVGADAQRYISERPKVRERLLAIVQQVTRLKQRQNDVGEQIEGLRSGHRSSEVREVADYAAHLDDIERRTRDQDRLLFGTEQTLADKSAALEEMLEKIKRAKTGNERAVVVQRRLESADRIQSAVQRILAIRRERTREQLDERIKQTYEQIAFKAYVPELSADFRLRLVKKVGSTGDVTVNKGQGENQLLALSFVGALALLARERFEDRERANKDSLSTFEGGIYPIVMDSPFGALDENYRRELARVVPKLAPQVVTMVSKSQGLGVVHDELLGRIGKSWVISFETTKSDARIETLQVDGKVEPYISHSVDGFESAHLLELT